MAKANTKTLPRRSAELEFTPTNCHTREVLARVGDTWSVYVMHVLGDGGPVRFNEMRKQIDGISQRMLTVTLRGLERDGLVTRAVFPEVPPRVEYALTPLGETLRRIIRELKNWSVEHLPEVSQARAAYDAKHGRAAPSAADRQRERLERRAAR